MDKGRLYNILYQGIEYIGFFGYVVMDCTHTTEPIISACFFCFDLDGNGGYLFFPVEEIAAIESNESKPSIIIEFLQATHSDIKWLSKYSKVYN
jgi:hypothetical protein